MDTDVRRVAHAAAVIVVADIASVVSGLNITLAADVRFFLTRGLRQLSGSHKGGQHFSIGFDFCAPDTAVSNTEMLREIAPA